MASIFLSISFNRLDLLRADVMEVLIKSRYCDVLYGMDFDGERISTAIQERISLCDGLVALFSKKDQVLTNEWSTHPWVIEEATWASAKEKRVLRVIEEGVSRLGGIAGDVEESRFPTGQFEIVIPKILSFVDSVGNSVQKSPQIQVVERQRTYSIVPTEPIEDIWGDEVKTLIEETREKAEQQLFHDALALSDKAIGFDSRCWRAYINRGVALVHLGRYQDAEEAFDYVAKEFTDLGPVVALALHNKAWLISRRDGLANESTFSIRKDLYMQSLSLDNRRIYTRAIVLIYFVLMGEQDRSKPFLEASLKWDGFVLALRREIDAMGGLGLVVAGQFPQWLRDLLHPTEQTTIGEK